MRPLTSPGPSACLDEAAVLALLAGTSDGDEATLAAQRQHLEECIDCQELLSLLESRDESEAHIDRYVVRREIGRGSMGTVFLAHDPELDRPVAVKVLRLAGAEARMRKEARSLARLAHPNVVTVFDVGTHEGRVFMAMEHVEGVSLRAWLGLERRSRETITSMLLQAGEGLAAAHDAGIVHRDIKPENILVGDDGRVRVLDFGLAHVDTLAEGGRAPTAVTTTTRLGLLVGTPAYMAPELFAGKPADARSDQFGFAVTLAEALFGERPVRGTTMEEIGARARRGEVTLPDAPSDPLLAVLRRALAARPEDRYPSLRELLVEVRGAAMPPRTARRALAGAAVVVGLVGLALGARALHGDATAIAASVPSVTVAAAIDSAAARVDTAGTASAAIGLPEPPTSPVVSALAPDPAAGATSRGARTDRSAASDVTRPRSTRSTTAPSHGTRTTATIPMGANETPLLE